MLQPQVDAPPAGATVASVQAAIDTKNDRITAIEGRLNEIAAQTATPASEGFFLDILSDANGVSFHRFQMFAWTLVLGLGAILFT